MTGQADIVTIHEAEPGLDSLKARSVHRILATLVLLLLPLLAALGAACGISSQEAGANRMWVAEFDGPVSEDDRSQATAIDALGNVYLAGCTWNEDTSFDYVVIKYDTEGSQQWVRVYDGPASGRDCAQAVAVHNSEYVVITGWSQGQDTSTDFATIKLDSDGKELWVARYDGPASGHDLACAVALDYSGNIYVTGWSQGDGTEADIVTLKYSREGDQVWAARYDGPAKGSDRAYAIAVDGWGNVYVAGASMGDKTNSDFVTIKYGGGGEENWAVRYDGPVSGEDHAQALSVDWQGNVYVTGWSEGDGAGTEFVTIKYDTNGNEIWVNRYNGLANGEDKAVDLVVDTWGNCYVTGWSENPGSDLDYLTIKYNTSGTEVWQSRYDGPKHGRDLAHSIAVDGWGNVYVTGASLGDRGSKEFATVKYDHNGEVIWVERYHGTGNGDNRSYAVKVDSLGNPHVSGRSSSDGSTHHYTTIKYSR
ncbi:MAG: SBBP repeat-containing protein [Dehalococcoidia bacterium]|nr:SBBP repeat-containing protein [Dehalococcoidia bacterium]